ncbi:MAG TPA: DUF448 domain-containing protein [Thermoleophilia bacterium]|nr:DUF448 domain-containing protein [Thermoleophilia bacterium]
MHEPWRQCIGCGRRGPQGEFIRLTLDTALSPAQVVPVRERQHRGRGAYLCRRQACLDRAVQRRAFRRAFRTDAAVDVDRIAAVMMEAQIVIQVNDTAGG